MTTATTTAKRFVYFFGEGHADGGGDLKHLVGGKGASLADMTRAQLNVPPGFTISAECCDLWYRSGKKWPDGLEEEVRSNLARLEHLAGRQFGAELEPLLVAVRSGAAQSMPGMMDTVLNVGLNADCVRTLAGRIGGGRATWQAYRHFLVLFGQTVGGVAEGVFTGLVDGLVRESGKKKEDELDAGQMETLCQRFREAYQTHAGRELPADPWEQLVQAVNAVFGSWNSERAIAYRKHHHIHGLLGTAVTVQMMCPSEVSGVMFTANPVDSTLEQIIIESSYGLGEAIVLGKVTPDRFVLDRASGKIIERDISHKDHVISTVTADARSTSGRDETNAASLTDPQIEELARLGRRVEDYFQMPCDIEWGLSQSKFYLLQARAIKGLEDAKLIASVRRQTIERLKQEAGGQPCAWVIYNLAETLPKPTPLTWDVMKRFMSGVGGFGLMYQDLGFLPSERVKREGFLDLVCGRICLNTRRHAELLWSNLPYEHDLEEIKQDPSKAEGMPAKWDGRRISLGTILQLPAAWWKMGRSGRTINRLRKDFDQQFNQTILPPYLDYVRTKQAEDLAKYDEAALVRELEVRVVRVLNDFGKEASKLSYFGGEAYGALTSKLRQLFPRHPDVATSLITALTAGLDHDKTVEANLKLMDVARGGLTREQFLEDFGHRASPEFELSQPRWREDATFVDHMVENFRANLDADPHKLHDKMRKRRLEAELRLPDELKKRGQFHHHPDLVELCDRVRRYLPYRETAKHYLLMGYELVRLILLEIDRRQGLSGGVFFLRYEELPGLMSGKNYAQQIAERRELRRAEARVNVPDLVLWDDLEAIGRQTPATPGGEVWGEGAARANGDGLQGTPVAPGSGTGPAAVVFDPAEAKGLVSGYVLVCPSTDPGWTPLFIRAAALIMERGGVLSHGAVVARDLGIPAVVIKGATKAIQPGDVVRVDGNTGSAYRVRK